MPKQHLNLALGSPTQQQGLQAEDRAAQYLQEASYRIIQRNFRCRLGEIDVIAMSPAHQLVFVEVRSRKTADYGGAAASISRAKQQRIVRCAQVFLHCHPQYATFAMRFDAVTFEGPTDAPTVRWILGAFTMT